MTAKPNAKRINAASDAGIGRPASGLCAALVQSPMTAKRNAERNMAANAGPWRGRSGWKMWSISWADSVAGDGGSSVKGANSKNRGDCRNVVIPEVLVGNPVRLLILDSRLIPRE